MSITDNEEFKTLKEKILKTNFTRFECVDCGGEAAEAILTAQHDKEMEELLSWSKYEGIYFDADSGSWVMDKNTYTFPELLALFRNRNK